MLRINHCNDQAYVRVAAPVSRHVFETIDALSGWASEPLLTSNRRAPSGRSLRFDLFGFDADMHRYIFSAQRRAMENRGLRDTGDASDRVNFCIQVDLFGYEDCIASHRFGVGVMARADALTELVPAWGLREGYLDFDRRLSGAAIGATHLSAWLDGRFGTRDRYPTARLGLARLLANTPAPTRLAEETLD